MQRACAADTVRARNRKDNTMKKQMILPALLLAFTALASAPALADFNPHDWQLRLRGINVSPHESSSTSLGGEASVDNSVVPELDITYFMTENFSLELILATSKHDVAHQSPNLGLGSVWVLPPTLTAQYRFNNETPFVPYIGAGINYTIFYNADSGAASKVSYDNGFGYALQAGMDYKLDDHWSLNLDVKKIFLNTDVRVTGPAATADVDLDPWVFGAGVGYRF